MDVQRLQPHRTIFGDIEFQRTQDSSFCWLIVWTNETAIKFQLSLAYAITLHKSQGLTAASDPTKVLDMKI